MQLANTEEFIDGQLAGNLGEVLIRYVSSEHLWQIIIISRSMLYYDVLTCATSPLPNSCLYALMLPY